jgi:subtilisin family serine protease
MESAWDTSTGSGVVVAVFDTGVVYEDYCPYCQAPDFAGTTFVQGYDFVNDDTHSNDDYVRPYAHGTHVTGTIAQTTNNNESLACGIRLLNNAHKNSGCCWSRYSCHEDFSVAGLCCCNRERWYLHWHVVPHEF